MADLTNKKYIDEAALTALIKKIKSADASTLSDAKTYVGSIPADQKDNYDDVVSYLEGLIDDSSSAGEVTMEEVTSGLADSVLKSYEFYQGVKADDTADQKAAKKIGTINLAKDLVVTAGEVVKLAANEVDGLTAGTYLKLTIANQTAPVYINVLDLVNDFTVKANADEVQLAISDTREISASLVDGSISRDKIDTDFEANIAAIEAAIGSENDALVSVTNRIKAEAKDATYKAATSAVGTEGTDGYVPAKEAVTIAGAIAALEEAIGDGGSVADAIKEAVEALDVAEVGGTGKLITTVSETDGKISATAIEVTSITGDLSKAAAEEGGTATPRTVKEYVDDSVKALNDNYVAITETEVNTLFTNTSAE